MDHEALYGLLYERRWAEGLDVIHRRAEALRADPLLARAVETFLREFFVEVEVAPGGHADALEKLFLLHTAHLYRLPYERFAGVVEQLVILHEDRPEAALGYARYCPENERCAALLRRYESAPPPPVAHGRDDAVRLARSLPLTEADHTISLFRSQQEADFFLAVREVFATYFVYPNVALNSLVDYEAIRDELSGRERRYFFRALVDCVVFDQHDGYRPRFFFELDSPLHDAEVRKASDRMKERILALAGQKLYRLRCRRLPADRADFVALLKELAVAD